MPFRLLPHVRRLLLGASCLAPLAACDLGPAYRRLATELPAAFRAAPDSRAVWPTDDWWKGFQSPELNGLIDAARDNNPDIAAAIARIRQADAQVRITGASMLPTVSGSGSADWQHVGAATGSSSSRLRSGGGNASFDLHSYAVGLNAAYELDFWGHYAAQRQAAVTSAMFSRFDQRTVALTVTYNVANSWFTALALADRLALAERNLRDAEQTLAVIRGRFAAGTANALDVSQQEALTAGERAVLPSLRNQMEQAVIGLGILTGRPPEAVTVRPGTLTALALPPVAPGLPSELLIRRPDVAAAEAQLVAQNFSVKAARAAFFPSVQLTSSAGFQGAALNHLVGPGGALLTLAGNLTAPVFDGGTLRGVLEQAKGRYDELLAGYRKAILQAFTDTDNALTAWRFTTEQERLQGIAVETARRSAAIARAQMAAGTVDILSVLTAETTLFNAEDTLAQVRLAQFQALLGLYKALGGGWEGPGAVGPELFPGLTPGQIQGGVALPIGSNLE